MDTSLVGLGWGLIALIGVSGFAAMLLPFRDSERATFVGLVAVSSAMLAAWIFRYVLDQGGPHGWTQVIGIAFIPVVVLGVAKMINRLLAEALCPEEHRSMSRLE